MTTQTAEQQILENEENLTQPNGFSFDSQLFVAVISGPIGGVIFALFHSYYLRTLKKSFLSYSVYWNFGPDNLLYRQSTRQFRGGSSVRDSIGRSHYYFCKEEQDAMVESGHVKNPWVAGILISCWLSGRLCIYVEKIYRFRA